MRIIPEYGKSCQRPAPIVRKSGLSTTYAMFPVATNAIPLRMKRVPIVVMKGLIFAPRRVRR